MGSIHYKRATLCFLKFLHTTSGLTGLCMSTYSLAWNIGKPWQWDHMLVVCSIAISIVSSSMKDAFLTICNEERDDLPLVV